MSFIGLVFVSAAAYGLAPAASAAGELEARIARVENGLLAPIGVKGRPAPMRLAVRMAELRVPGLSIAVINDGKLAWARAYGVAEEGTTRPVLPETLFHSGTMSVALASLAIQRQSPGAERPPTSRTVPFDERYRGFDGKPLGRIRTLSEMLDATRSELVSATGKDFETAMRDLVFAPAGMQFSTFHPPVTGAALAYSAKGAGQDLHHPKPEHTPYGLWSTPSELARMIVSLQAAGDGKSLLAMLGREEGRGILVDQEGSLEKFGQLPDYAGFTFMLVYSSLTRQGVVMMANSMHADRLLGEVVRSIAAEYGWTAHRMTEHSVVQLETGLHERYVGRYGNAGAPLFVVFEDGKRLMISHGENRRHAKELLASNATTFFMLSDPATLAFETDAAGEVELVIKGTSPVQRYKRMP